RRSREQTGLVAVRRLVKDRVTPKILIELGDACRRRRTKPLTDPQTQEAQRTAAEQRAGSLLDDPAILSRVGEAIRANGYAGRLEPAQLAHVALTSRLLEERAHQSGVSGGSRGREERYDRRGARIGPAGGRLRSHVQLPDGPV